MNKHLKMVGYYSSHAIDNHTIIIVHEVLHLAIADIDYADTYEFFSMACSYH